MTAQDWLNRAHEHRDNLHRMRGELRAIQVRIDDEERQARRAFSAAHEEHIAELRQARKEMAA